MLKPRKIVKSLKDYVVWSATASAASYAMNTVIDEPTENQDAGIELGSAAIGFVVMRAAKSRTDQMIDSVVDWRTNRKVAESLPV